MKLENQVCSLELAEKLKELGFGQDSLYKWTPENRGETFYICSSDCLHGKDYPCYSAYTVAELGEMLPFYIREDANKGISFSTETDGLKIERFSNGWTIYYRYRSISDKTLAEAMAKMLIYLKENNLIN